MLVVGQENPNRILGIGHLLRHRIHLIIEQIFPNKDDLFVRHARSGAKDPNDDGRPEVGI